MLIVMFISGLAVGLICGVGLMRYGMGLGFKIEQDIRNDLAPLEDIDDDEMEQTHTDGRNLE